MTAYLRRALLGFARSLARPPAAVATAAAVAVAVAVSLAAPGEAFAAAWSVETSSRTASEVVSRWRVLEPSWSGAAYSSTPRTSDPFAAGALRPEFLADGLRSVNFARFLAGLPPDVTLDDYYTTRDQHASVINAANGRLDHFPDRPAGMSDAFFELGREGAGSSNLAYGPVELEKAVRLYLWDSDQSNIAHLGHRRWILNPAMARTGFGQAGDYSSMWVFDRGRTEPVDYAILAWPAAGPFPIENFAAGTAWSVTPNPSRYSIDPARLVVTLRRASDGRTWTFTSADAISADRPFDGELFAYSTAGYGVAGCVVFRPPLDTAYPAGESFDVTLSAGITDRSTSQATSLAYRTSFMSLAATPPAQSTVSLSAPTTVVHGSSYALRTRLTESTSTPIAGRAVLFEYSLDGGRSWRSIASGVTDLDGRVSRTWVPTTTRPSMRVRARFPGETGMLPAQSSAIVAVRPYLSIWAPSTATRSKAFSVSATMRPRHSVGSYPASVKASRLVDGKWVYKSGFRAKVTANTTTSSRLSASVVLPAGTWRLKLYHAADTYHTSAYSSARVVVVK